MARRRAEREPAGGGPGEPGPPGTRPYGPLDHTADIGLWVRGPDLKTLFAHAALGLRELMDIPLDAGAGAAATPEERERLVVLEASDAEALLVDWLNELLYLLDTERLAPVSAEVELRGCALRAQVRMESLGPGRAPRREIKAATFHGLQIAGGPGAYEARVIFDI